MNSLDLLRRARERQIDAAEGRDPGPEIERPVIQHATKHERWPKSEQLRFSAHARERMAQRSRTARHVYAIYRYGESWSQGDRVIYTASDKAIREATAVAAAVLREVRGEAIVVAPGRVLVTVLAAGEDTRVWGSENGGRL